MQVDQVIAPLLQSQADLPQVEFGITVQAEDVRRTRDPSLADDIDGSPGHGLLARLKDQAHGAGDPLNLREGSYDESGSQHNRGVRIVTAGMRHTLATRSILRRRAIGHREGIDIGTKHPERSRGIAGHIADHTGADLQRLRMQAGDLEPLRDGLGGRVLGVRQLRLGVQTAAEGNELVLPGMGEGGDGIAHVPGAPSARTDSSNSPRRWLTTSGRLPVSAMTRRWRT